VKPATLSPAADRDLSDAVRWIAKDNPAAARALRSSVAKAATTIGDFRYAGSVRPEIVDAPYQCFALRGFPCVILYDAERSPPRIMRILHGARDLPEVLRDL
jgi:toxin ParE1/3/4